MDKFLKLRIENEYTALPRILQIIQRQGFNFQELIMRQPADKRFMDIVVVLEDMRVSERLVRSLKKQVSVLQVEVLG